MVVRVETPEEQRMHSIMAIILLVALFGSQFVIAWWKQKHPSSYTTASLLGLWLIPMYFGYQAGNTRYVFIWTIFSVSNAFVVRKALEKPMDRETPGLVYRWFALIYSGSFLLGLVGYLLFIFAFFQIFELFGISLQTEISLFKTGIIVLFYGLYFGVLGRDIIDKLSDYMATSLGYYSKAGFPSKHLRDSICAICGSGTDGGQLVDLGVEQQQKSVFDGLFYYRQGLEKNEKIYQLDCKHQYHERCIRGWTLIGKKDMCPYCKEKVDMRAFKGTHPWELSHEFHLNMLDGCRYVLVWNPIVLILVQIVFKIFGLH